MLAVLLVHILHTVKPGTTVAAPTCAFWLLGQLFESEEILSLQKSYFLNTFQFVELAGGKMVSMFDEHDFSSGSYTQTDV